MSVFFRQIQPNKTKTGGQGDEGSGEIKSTIREMSSEKAEESTLAVALRHGLCVPKLVSREEQRVIKIPPILTSQH